MIVDFRSELSQQQARTSDVNAVRSQFCAESSQLAEHAAKAANVTAEFSQLQSDMQPYVEELVSGFHQMPTSLEEENRKLKVRLASAHPPIVDRGRGVGSFASGRRRFCLWWSGREGCKLCLWWSSVGR